MPNIKVQASIAKNLAVQLSFPYLGHIKLSDSPNVSLCSFFSGTAKAVKGNKKNNRQALGQKLFQRGFAYELINQALNDLNFSRY